jgi:hypothetical protein
MFGALRELLETDFLCNSLLGLHSVLQEGWQIGDVRKCATEGSFTKKASRMHDEVGWHEVEHDCSRYV